MKSGASGGKGEDVEWAGSHYYSYSYYLFMGRSLQLTILERIILVVCVLFADRHILVRIGLLSLYNPLTWN